MWLMVAKRVLIIHLFTRKIPCLNNTNPPTPALEMMGFSSAATWKTFQSDLQWNSLWWLAAGGEVLLIIASIYQTPGQCHYLNWQHPMVQLLTRVWSAMLSRSVLGTRGWALAKKETNSRSLEFDPTLPQS